MTAPSVALAPFRRPRDLSLLAVWLRRPHVARWWGDPAAALADAASRAAGTAAVVIAQGRPVGYLCWQSPSRAELEAAGLADLPDDLADIDLMIGEPDMLGRGVGPAALQRLCERLAEGGARLVGIATARANRRALAAFRRAGFSPYRTFFENGEHYAYLTKRLACAAAPGAASAIARDHGSRRA